MPRQKFEIRIKVGTTSTLAKRTGWLKAKPAQRVGGGRSKIFQAAVAQGMSTTCESLEAMWIGLMLVCWCAANALLALAGVCSKQANEHMLQLVRTAPMPELASTVTAMALRNITATMAAGRK